jgi:hypothetical protein
VLLARPATAPAFAFSAFAIDMHIDLAQVRETNAAITENKLEPKNSVS